MIENVHFECMGATVILTKMSDVMVWRCAWLERLGDHEKVRKCADFAGSTRIQTKLDKKFGCHVGHSVVHGVVVPEIHAERSFGRQTEICFLGSGKV